MMSRILTLLGLVLLSSIATAQPLSLSLREAQQMAIDSSYATRNARFNTEIKRKEVKEVLANGFPQINGTAELQNFLEIPTQLVPAQFFGGEEGEFAEIQFGTKYNFNAGISASQLIFDGTYLVGLKARSEEHTSELQSRPHLVCRLLLEKKKNKEQTTLICANHDHVTALEGPFTVLTSNRDALELRCDAATDRLYSLFADSGVGSASA